MAYQPPPGPPPGRKGPGQALADDFAPPPGPPPSQRVHETPGSDVEPPPYDPWMQVPDNSLLPPPPAFGYEESPTANATADSAERAHIWCQANPLYRPRNLSEAEYSSVRQGSISLIQYASPDVTVRAQRPGTALVQSRPNCQDSILLTDLPLFCSTRQWPPKSGPQTVYFELRVLRMGGDTYSGANAEADAGIALGFVAPPYPAFRLPGWERASLGVHGDDGRRYVNNNRGGRDFTTSFQTGEVVGIGMRLQPHAQRAGSTAVEVFFTRDGRVAGSWDLFEERDAETEGDVHGLDGSRDLHGAIGFFGGVQFEARFRRDEWLYRP